MSDSPLLSAPDPHNSHTDTSPVSPVALQPSDTPVPADNPPEPSIPYSWQEFHPDACLIYTRDHKEANQAIAQLDNNTTYGFDLEWKPNFVKGQRENPVALVQIANHKAILLLQITAMQEFPSGLRDFLLDSTIVKTGVGIQNDAQKLYRDWKVDIKSCADLSLLARSVDNDKWKGKYSNPLGLARLVATYQDRALSKGKKTTRSNWERLLNEQQQTYAANDAHAGYVVYTELMNMMPSVSPIPDVKYYSFDSIRGHLYDPSGEDNWQPFNPNYDPGPPPLPKPPRVRKQKNRIPNNTTSTEHPQATTSTARFYSSDPVPFSRGSSNTRGYRGGLPHVSSSAYPRSDYNHLGRTWDHHHHNQSRTQQQQVPQGGGRAPYTTTTTTNQPPQSYGRYEQFDPEDSQSGGGRAPYYTNQSQSYGRYEQQYEQFDPDDSQSGYYPDHYYR